MRARMSSDVARYESVRLAPPLEATTSAIASLSATNSSMLSAIDP
jgi:hypothetical protein